MRPAAALTLLLLAALAWLPAPSLAATSVYYADLQAGLYKLSLSYGSVLIVDAYGNPVPTLTVSGSFIPDGIYFTIPSNGRYYFSLGASGPQAAPAQVFGDLTPQVSTTSGGGTLNYLTQDYVFDTDPAKLSWSLQAKLSGSTSPYYKEIIVYCEANMTVQVSWTHHRAATGTSRSPLIIYGFDGTVVYQAQTIYYAGDYSSTATITLLGSGSFKIRIQNAYSGDWTEVNLTKTDGWIVRQQPQASTVALTPAERITITLSSETLTVYAHNFTITSTGDQQLEWFIVPVDTSEVSQLTSLNPVVLEPEINVVRPARLVRIAGQDFIVFQAWSNRTSNQYTVIWNYPQSTGLQGFFVDSFTSDPLLTWQESLKTNVSRVEYSNNMLYVYGDSYEYILARTLDANYSAGLAYMVGDYKQLWLGNSSFELAPLAYPEAWTLFISGALYGASITSDTATLTFTMRRIFSYNWTQGNTIAIAVSSDTNTTAQIGGVIAVPSIVEYNATLDKQLLRLKITVEKYEIGYSLPNNVGYWTHMVQVVIYYDPTMLPPTDYFNVRLLLPEQQWLQQGLCRPGLADIAITDSQSNLVDFWVEPYMLPDGSRGVWVKLPADPSKNMYVLNILLNNTMLTTSLSTPNAFIQYYSDSYGLGSSWSQDADGYIVTQNVYVNTIVVVPKASGFGFKLALTPSDYYTVDPYGVTEVHSAYVQQIHNFTGFFVEQQLQWIYFEKSGKLQYYQGKTLLWEVSDLNKPWSWPPVIVGARDASFIGLAILVPYSYSIGTVTGGQWGYAQQAEKVQIGSPSSKISWSDLGQLVLAMSPLIILAIVMRLIQNPPSITKTASGGAI